MGWGFFPPIFRDEKVFTLFESTNEAVSENRFFWKSSQLCQFQKSWILKKKIATSRDNQSQIYFK